MKNVSEGQQWKEKDDYHGWNSLHIKEKLNDDRWIVDIMSDPPMRDIIMTSEKILNRYDLSEAK